MQNRSEIIHQNFLHRVSSGDLPDSANELKPEEAGLNNEEIVDLFESQITSRLLDIISRRLRTRDESFYTIGSSGHEVNAVFGRVFRYTDMAFLHYRSCALLIQRSKQLPDQTPVKDILLSFIASSEDPVSGGRHKVLGSKSLFVPPQTSTIASHLPKAMGTAFAIGLAGRLTNVHTLMPDDSVVLCNFGDATVNHSTALGAINAAVWTAHQNIPMPIVFICEDNEIGISVPSPPGWIQTNFDGRKDIKYFYSDGLNLLDTHRTTLAAVSHARNYKKPVFLHVRLIRLMGHAGSDLEIGYRTQEQIELTEAQDPLLHSARILIEHNILSADEICDLYRETEAEITRLAEQVITRPRLGSAGEIMEPIVPKRVDKQPAPLATANKRDALFIKEQIIMTQPQALARQINLALADIMLQYENTIIFGEDVGKKGGVYGVTNGLLEKFGATRVIDTLLDEQSILGLAIGLAHNGFIGIPEIQFLAYLHNAEDQIRGEAATLSFFSNSQFSNPMLVRIPGLSYQKGFGGHFHNDNSLAVLRDIPGIVIACPSNGSDAVQMLRTCMELAYKQQRVVIFIEPIALYTTHDLFEKGDGKWASVYQSPDIDKQINKCEAGVWGGGQDLCIITYGNGYYLSRKAVRTLQEQYNIDLCIIDLRWLAPVDESTVLNTSSKCKHILIVDECRRTGSISEALITLLVENNIQKPMSRVTAEDSFIPLGNAANLVLPSVESIIESALRLLNR